MVYDSQFSDWTLWFKTNKPLTNWITVRSTYENNDENLKHIYFFVCNFFEIPHSKLNTYYVVQFNIYHEYQNKSPQQVRIMVYNR